MESSKIWVQLKDTGSIFSESAQNANVTGTRCATFIKSPKVRAALNKGIIREVSEKEALEINAKLDNVKKAEKITNSAAEAIAVKEALEAKKALEAKTLELAEAYERIQALEEESKKTSSKKAEKIEK